MKSKFLLPNINKSSILNFFSVRMGKYYNPCLINMHCWLSSFLYNLSTAIPIGYFLDLVNYYLLF